MTEIMMIEDDLQITELLRRFLERFGMRVNGFAAPADALRSLRIDHYDLIILDLSLPQMDGLEVCKTIRASYTTPIIISSARSDLADKVAALELGADDYLPKPYEPRELVARIQTVLRRYRQTLQPSAGSEPFFVDEQKMLILKEGRQLELTLAEYEILRLLILKRGTVVSRDFIANNVDAISWESSDHSINVIISRIRSKIGAEYIRTVHGVGYKFTG